MNSWESVLAPLNISGEGAVFVLFSIVTLLVIILLLQRTYRASVNVEARLAEFSSLSGNPFGGRLKLIEASSEAFHLNRAALGPLARIIDEYCVVTIKPDGLVTYCNEPFMAVCGQPQSALVGSRPDFNADSMDTRFTWPRLLRNLNPDKVWHGDVCLGTPGGKRWLDCFAFPISFISLNEDGYILFGTDITDIKQQNADLQQEVQRRGETINRIEGMLLNSEKMASLGVISAGIAHEINNPLAFVDANMRHITQHTDSMKRILERVYRHLPPEQLARLLDRAETPLREPRQLAAMLEDMPDLIDETRDGVGRIRKIVQDLKFFSSQRDQADEHVDLDHCINIALNLARHETRNRIQVICEGDDDAPAIHGSETQLSQVFLNLIMNAAQAMEGRGAIHIRRHTVDGCCHVSVRDDGPGIPDSVIESIFEPFFTTKPAGEGTGLGLAISQDIVRRHGGTISVSSIPGKGTTFSMVFPLQQARSHHAA